MLTVSPNDLIQTLKGETLRVRTGLWLAPKRILGCEADEATRLNIDAVDLRQPLLSSLPNGAQFLGLSADKIIQLFDVVCQTAQGSECLLVFNLDLLLSRLRQQERDWVWSQMYNGFPHRSRALLLLMPAEARHLIPPLETLRVWQADKRLAVESDFNL
jgi:hypothetical protein